MLGSGGRGSGSVQSKSMGEVRGACWRCLLPSVEHICNTQLRQPAGQTGAAASASAPRGRGRGPGRRLMPAACLKLADLAGGQGPGRGRGCCQAGPVS